MLPPKRNSSKAALTAAMHGMTAVGKGTAKMLAPDETGNSGIVDELKITVNERAKIEILFPAIGVTVYLNRTQTGKLMNDLRQASATAKEKEQEIEKRRPKKKDGEPNANGSTTESGANADANANGSTTESGANADANADANGNTGAGDTTAGEPA